MPDTVLLINAVILLILILLSAFFSCSETALFSLSRARLLNYKKQKSSSCKAIVELLDSYHTTLIVLILTNMFVNIGITIISEHILLAVKLGPLLTSLVSVFISVVILLIFGEIIPKTIALINAEKISGGVAIPILILRRFLSPVVILAEKISSFILGLLGKRKIIPLNPEEYSSYLDLADTSGAFSRAETQLISTALELREKLVAEVMTGRIETSIIPGNLHPDEVVKIIRREKHEFFPIIKQDIDDAEHFLSVREFFLLTEAERQQWAQKNCVFTAVSIPENTSLTLALTTMRQRKIPAALAVDEYGRVTGMITSKDIYAVLVGNLDGSTPGSADFDMRQLHENVWVVDGMTPLYSFEDMFNLKLPDEFESNTLNGLFCEVIGRIPVVGDEILIANIKMQAESVVHHCISRMRIELPEPEEKT